MIWRARTGVLLLALAVLLVAKLGQQVYRWVAFAEEREALRGLSISLDSAGLAVVRSQLQADSLRTLIDFADRKLERERGALLAQEDRMEGGDLSYPEYRAYRSRLLEHNRRVRERNARYERWKGVVDRNHRAVRRYNALADSIRGLADRMGEPYYAIPTPAEVAVRHGMKSEKRKVQSEE